MLETICSAGGSAGVSHRIGNLMSYWILIPNVRVISRTTVQRVTNLVELQSNEVRQQYKEHDERVNELLKDENHIVIPAEESERFKTGTNTRKTTTQTLRMNSINLYQTTAYQRRMTHSHMTRCLMISIYTTRY